MKKNHRLFCCVKVRDFEPKLMIKGVDHTKKKFDRKLIFSYEERYTYYESKKAIYVTVLPFMLYSI